MPDFQIGYLAYPWVTLIFFKRDVCAMTKVTNRTGGPNTKRGKEISSKNARTHGLTAKKWIDDEEQSLYDDMLKELSDDLKPQGFAQELMIARLADCAVRMNRTQRIEDALYKLAKEESSSPESIISSLTKDNEKLKQEVTNQFSLITKPAKKLDEEKLILFLELKTLGLSAISGFSYLIEKYPSAYEYLCEQCQKEQLSIKALIDRETQPIKVTFVVREETKSKRRTLSENELLKDSEIISAENIRKYLTGVMDRLAHELRIESVMVQFKDRKNILEASATPESQKMSLIQRYRTADERLFSKILGEFYEMQKIKGQR